MGEETGELFLRLGRMKAARERKAAVEAAEAAVWERVIALAKGCTDYGGGHSGECAEAFQDGIWTVGEVLERAREQGATPPDLQLRVVESIGRDVQSLTARLEAAEADRDKARRVLLAMADACESCLAAHVINTLDEALHLDPFSMWTETAAALRKLCGVSDVD